MAGRPGAGIVKALQALMAGKGKITPYAAARQAGIDLGTMYKSALYKKWKSAQRELDPDKREEILRLLLIELARRESELSTMLPRVAKKPQRFAAAATNKQH